MSRVQNRNRIDSLNRDSLKGEYATGPAIADGVVVGTDNWVLTALEWHLPAGRLERRFRSAQRSSV